MKKQRNQLIALAILVAAWAAYWSLFVRLPQPPPAAVSKEKPSKASRPESPLQTRFRRVHSQMDALYHFRIKPTPFDPHWNPFRITGMMNGSGDLASPPGSSKEVKGESAPSGQPGVPPDLAEILLKRAVAVMRIGGVVTMNGTTQLTVDGQLHREGDVFAAKVPSATGPAKTVLIRVKHLSTGSVTLALEDSEAGGAEIRVRLN